MALHLYVAQLTKVTLPGNPYAHDTAIGVRVVLSIHIYNAGIPNIGPFQIKVTDLDTGLIDLNNIMATVLEMEQHLISVYLMTVRE